MAIAQGEEDFDAVELYAERLLPFSLKPLGLRILMEPGRFISGNAGMLVTRIEYVKQTGRKNFLIVDAAMNDLIRPAFYEAYHQIVPVVKRKGKLISSDVVGPVCESGDFFAKDRPLPKVGEGDHLALLSAGAYGFVMASNYNTRPLAAEVLVNGKKSALVRERQPVADIWAGEENRAVAEVRQSFVVRVCVTKPVAQRYRQVFAGCNYANQTISFG